MPWYLRKSFGSKGFRINVSKSGIGLSSGVKGFRVSTNSRGTYVHMGRGGVYYRQRIGGPWGTQAQQSPPPGQAPSQPFAQPPAGMTAIGSASAHQLIDDTNAAILAKLNARLKEPTYAWLAWLATLGLALAGGLFVPWLAMLILLLGIIPIALVSKEDVKRRTYPLLYELDPGAASQWNDLCNALSRLASSHRIWRVTAVGATQDWKRQAGASHLIQRTSVGLLRRSPPHIATNVQPYCLQIGTQWLCFMPDRLLVFENGRYGAVDYPDLRIEVGATNYIESESVPRDARIVGSTWQYVNKDGSPDRRFNYNREIPICSYQIVQFSSARGLNVVLYASSHAFQGLSSSPQVPGGRVGASGTQGPSPGGGSTATATKAKATIPDCYIVLGLTPDCTEAEAQATYRALAKHYHPDLVAHMAPEFRALAEERMKEINGAYWELRRLRGWA